MAPFETSARLELRDRTALLNQRFAGKGGAEVLEGAIRREFSGRIGLVSSFGAESAVLLHMVARIDPYVPVIFLDTWKHFPETVAYRDELVKKLGLCNIQIVSPRPAALKADDPDGTRVESSVVEEGSWEPPSREELASWIRDCRRCVSHSICHSWTCPWARRGARPPTASRRPRCARY